MFANFNQNRKVKFDNRTIGDNERCFITFEAGPTHYGIDSALKLSSYAKEAGGDAIKFQMLDAEKLVSDKKMNFKYKTLVNPEKNIFQNVEEPLFDILLRRQLSKDQWLKLKNHCDKIGLLFFVTILFEEDLDFINELKCQTIKIASADINYIPLIKKIAETNKCIQIDTGNASLGEVEQTVKIITEMNNKNIIIHHCPSGYPARLESINLKIIETLRTMFNFPIAFSDHSPGIEMDIAALALGANMIEKTITLDKTIKSPEHAFSLEPDKMRDFVLKIKELEIAFGKSYKNLSKEEIESRNQSRRSLFLKKDATKGTKFENLVVDFKRPGNGIQPDKTFILNNAVLKRSKKSGSMLKIEDFNFS